MEKSSSVHNTLPWVSFYQKLWLENIIWNKQLHLCICWKTLFQAILLKALCFSYSICAPCHEGLINSLYSGYCRSVTEMVQTWCISSNNYQMRLCSFLSWWISFLLLGLVLYMCLKLPQIFLGKREIQVKINIPLLSQAFWESIPIKSKSNLHVSTYIWEKPCHSLLKAFSFLPRMWNWLYL